MTTANASLLVREVLRAGTPQGNASLLVREVLRAGTPLAQTSFLIREVLRAATTPKAQISLLIREVLRQYVPPWWPNRQIRIASLSDEDEDMPAKRRTYFTPGGSFVVQYYVPQRRFPVTEDDEERPINRVLRLNQSSIVFVEDVLVEPVW